MNAQTKIKATTPSPSYVTDGYGWAMAQSQLLRERHFSGADWDNIIEEIECVGRRERSEYESHLIRVLTHMIKWDAHPERRGISWWLSIMNGRDKAERFLAKNWSLKPHLEEIFTDALRYARRRAAQETGIDRNRIDAVEVTYEDAISKPVPRPESDD